MTLVVRAATVAEDEVAALLAELDAEYVRRWGHGDDESVHAEDLAAPRGALFVADLDGSAVGMAGWRRDEDQAEDRAEVKRMFVRPSARGQGVARALLDSVEASARSCGVRDLLLVTGELQPEATALYRSTGYVDVAPFGVYADGPTATFLGKQLT